MAYALASRGKITPRDRMIFIVGFIFVIGCLAYAAAHIHAPKVGENLPRPEGVDILPSPPHTPWVRYLTPRELSADQDSPKNDDPSPQDFYFDQSKIKYISPEPTHLIVTSSNAIALELDLDGHYVLPPKWSDLCIALREQQIPDGYSVLLRALSRAEHHPCPGRK